MLFRSAHQADAFTTVSEITARECEQLLERRPDVVTPNGFEKNFVPAPAKFDAVRAEARASLIGVANALTGAEYDDNAFVVITSGRCEYRNKGIDIYLDMADTLRHLEACRKVIAYVMVPAWPKEARADLRARLDSQAMAEGALDEPVLTHWLNNPDSDMVAGRIRSLGFCNIDSRVTVIYVPCYLNGTDGIFGRDYYDLLIGADATVFPSYYEPWGYTPLESVAFGVPTVTTSLSGFGQWVLESFENYFEECGVNVIGRGDSNYHDVVNNIANSIRYLTCADRRTMSRIRRAAMRTAAAASWANFIAYYDRAYELALSKASSR